MNNYGGNVQILLIKHEYFTTEPDVTHDMEQDDDEILQVNVGDEIIRNYIYFDSGGRYKNMSNVLQPLMRKTGFNITTFLVELKISPRLFGNGQLIIVIVMKRIVEIEN